MNEPGLDRPQMTTEHPQRRWPTILDCLLVCTVSVTFMGSFLICSSIPEYFEEHARDHEWLGDLLALLAVAAILSAHYGLLFYLERFVPEETRGPRRAIFYLQLLAVILVGIIADSRNMTPALYISVSAGVVYMLVDLTAPQLPVLVNSLFLFIILALAALGIIARCVVLFTGSSREQRAAQRTRAPRKRMREEWKRYDQVRDRAEALRAEILREEHMERMGQGNGGRVEADETTDRPVEEIP